MRSSEVSSLVLDAVAGDVPRGTKVRNFWGRHGTALVVGGSPSVPQGTALRGSTSREGSVGLDTPRGRGSHLALVAHSLPAQAESTRQEGTASAEAP